MGQSTISNRRVLLVLCVGFLCASFGPATSEEKRAPPPWGEIAEAERIALRDQDALLASGKSDHDGVVQSRRVSDGRDIGPLFSLIVAASDDVQMDSRRHDFTTRQPPQAFFAAFRQARESAPAFARRPFQQGIMTAANDWRRGDMGERRVRVQAGQDPRSSATRGNSQRPVTLVHGTALFATSS